MQSPSRLLKVENPLLARGRDRLETLLVVFAVIIVLFPYSLGDAIDWKQVVKCHEFSGELVPYSLGDAIDWKLGDRSSVAILFPYSLGDAINWKLY